MEAAEGEVTAGAAGTGAVGAGGGAEAGAVRRAQARQTRAQWVRAAALKRVPQNLTRFPMRKCCMTWPIYSKFLPTPPA